RRARVDETRTPGARRTRSGLWPLLPLRVQGRDWWAPGADGLRGWALLPVPSAAPLSTPTEEDFFYGGLPGWVFALGNDCLHVLVCFVSQLAWLREDTARQAAPITKNFPGRC